MADTQHTCPTCGTQFLAKSPLRRYCQQKCTPGHIAKMASKREKRASAPPKPKADKPITHTDFVCVVCGQTFRPKHSDRTKCCSRPCGLELVGFKANARKTGARVIVSVNRCKCDVCGSRFDGFIQSRICGKECSMERERRRARLGSEAKHKSEQRLCKECGSHFTTSYGMKKRVYCSMECRTRAVRRTSKQLRRARSTGSANQRVDVNVVFDRDGWRCRICGKLTIRSKRGTAHPKAPELDHIVPLSLGGAHTYANTQCACRSCNGAKGAKAYGQLHLFPAPA